MQKIVLSTTLYDKSDVGNPTFDVSLLNLIMVLREQ